MNPYDFVRIDWDQSVVRANPAPQNAFYGWSGFLRGEIVAETPLFIPSARNLGSPARFATNAAGQYVMPGSSLKGLFRSLVETVGPGCWLNFDGHYRDNVHYPDKLPPGYRRCGNIGMLCPACAMFGVISGGAFAGKVGFEDAVCTEPVKYEPVYTPILDSPKPRHDVWYLDTGKKHLAGRKFYFHQSEIQTETCLKTSNKGKVLNQHIHPLGPGSKFSFSVYFSSLNDEEIKLLLYSIILEPTMRHKIGFGKPAGLGSIKVTLTYLRRYDMANHYRGALPEEFEGGSLQSFCETMIAPLVSNSSVTIADLRRIWAWPPGTTYRYPSRSWFTANSTVPISGTP